VNDVHEIVSSLETGDEHVLTLPEPQAFIYVGIIWLNQHHLFERLRRVDFPLNRMPAIADTVLREYDQRAHGR
jgi:hypothetical protein